MDHIILGDTMSYTELESKDLLDTATASINYGINHKGALDVDVSKFSKHLQENGASFVTLEIDNNLRGCIGSLQAHRPLIQDVATNAWSAAFRDPRFSPITKDELSIIEMHISVLTKPEPINFSSEADLLDKINPGLDGLILIDRGRQGTFLPSVWEQLPDKKTFFSHLKNKAGLPSDHWSATLQVLRYHTEVIN